jgi:hypothetical protein
VSKYGEVKVSIEMAKELDNQLVTLANEVCKEDKMRNILVKNFYFKDNESFKKTSEKRTTRP